MNLAKSFFRKLKSFRLKYLFNCLSRVRRGETKLIIKTINIATGHATKWRKVPYHKSAVSAREGKKFLSLLKIPNIRREILILLHLPFRLRCNWFIISAQAGSIQCNHTFIHPFPLSLDPPPPNEAPIKAESIRTHLENIIRVLRVCVHSIRSFCEISSSLSLSSTLLWNKKRITHQNRLNESNNFVWRRRRVRLVSIFNVVCSSCARFAFTPRKSIRFVWASFTLLKYYERRKKFKLSYHVINALEIYFLFLCALRSLVICECLYSCLII